MINVNGYVCNSCAVASIGEISTHTGPEDVMKHFCKTQLGVKDKYRTKYAILTCFYVFCAGPEVKMNEEGGTGHSANHWPRYGTEFAAFLTDNKLGKVATLPAKLNAKHHPTSTAQVWIWSPNQKAVEKWWDDFQSKGK